MKTFLSIALAACFVSCNVQNAPSDAPEFDEETTRTVLERHWDTFRNNDLEGVMADYDESSVLITPGETYVGLDAIRRNFENAFAAFPKDSTTMNLQQTVIEGDLAYIIWSATSPRVNLKFGTDTFVIRNGKIVRQTYAGVPGE